MIKDITDLDVYQHSLRLLPRLYEVLDHLPLSEKDSVIQAKRAAKSVPANLAEGFAKRFSEKEFKRFIMIALASNDEVLAHLKILMIVAPRFTPELSFLFDEYKILSKRINSLHKTWHFAGHN